MGIKVLSLFDGISCGMVALERAGIEVDEYYAYEIEQNAIKISEKNYPKIIHCGDVFNTDFSTDEIQNIDLLIGGSPCTHWSIVQKSERRETVASGIGWDLFSKYLQALHNTNPKYFIYENNKSMSDSIKYEISKCFGVNPILINSSLVSAQNRQRLYWTNIPYVTVPKDRGILLRDIIESGTVDRDKSLCITRRYAGFSGTQSYLCRRYFGKSIGQAVFEGDIESIKCKWMNNPYFESDEVNIRQLTVTECERLQTLPDGYTACDDVSKDMRYEVIGNGWTIDVIAHILDGIRIFNETGKNNLSDRKFFAKRSLF